MNEEGKTVPLSRYFESGKPVLLSIVYYNCPSLCGFVLNGLLATLKNLEGWTPGDQFELVTLSMDHREGPELAREKKAAFIGELGNPAVAQGWHFLTGSESQIRKLTDSVGFGFRWDAVQEEYAHQAGIFVLTPEGKLSRVLFGIDYPVRDVRLALVEAGEGKTGTFVDQMVLFCFRYDPSQRGYALYAFRLVQVGSVLMTLAVGVYLAIFWRRQRRMAGEVIRGSAA
ncbi:MAG: SCO family protein [Bdellovibrionales bacterium]|nr:SCO family protein [Bdellovibrionales bacterium]